MGLDNDTKYNLNDQSIKLLKTKKPVTNITLDRKSNMAGAAFHRSQTLRAKMTNYSI